MWVRSYLTGKSRDEIRQDIAADYEKMLSSFINDASAKAIRKQLEDDVSSIPDCSWRIVGVPVEDPDIDATPNETPRAIETR